MSQRFGKALITRFALKLSLRATLFPMTLMALAKVQKLGRKQPWPMALTSHHGLGHGAVQMPFLLSLCFPLVPFPSAIFPPYVFSSLLFTSHSYFLSIISIPQSFCPQLGPELNLLQRPPVANCPQPQWGLIRAASLAPHAFGKGTF